MPQELSWFALGVAATLLGEAAIVGGLFTVALMNAFRKRQWR